MGAFGFSDFGICLSEALEALWKCLDRSLSPLRMRDSFLLDGPFSPSCGQCPLCLADVVYIITAV